MSSWTAIVGLDEPTTPSGDRPQIEVLARTTGANVVRISFRAGQVMAEHRTARPILVVGQRGDVDFTVEGETTRLAPGVAIHVEPDVTHALAASTDAVVTLLVLERTDTTD
ncbi:cupin domain-containing protein [Gordonia sp. CPCC 206044]|uniref:cupin domain-containing protein n=1 Tax=Gordonia sp. CPCC 206044 TaxID=3140793 RepID=UPI003AF366E0